MYSAPQVKNEVHELLEAMSLEQMLVYFVTVFSFSCIHMSALIMSIPTNFGRRMKIGCGVQAFRMGSTSREGNVFIYSTTASGTH